MANCITRHIPNALTCMNLFSGCIACVMAFHANFEMAMLFIVIGAVFDFFDGLAARLLHAYSNIGKDLDSLADDVSFGVAPALIVFSLFKEINYPDYLSFLANWLPYAAFLIASTTSSTAQQMPEPSHSTLKSRPSGASSAE